MKTSERSQPPQSGLDYGQMYRDILLTHDLTAPLDEPRWRAKPLEADPEPHDVVLYFGCNVLRNSDMVRTATDVLDLLDLDYTVVGGPAYCCGIVQHREGDTSRAQHTGAQAVEFLARYRPQEVILWCPSCAFYYDEAYEAEMPFPRRHMTEFLADRLDQFNFVAQAPRRIATHYHSNRPQRVREAEAARTLLAAAPGVSQVEIGSTKEFGTICSAQVGTGPPWQRRIRDQLRLAEEAGADTLATLYHGCQRLICAFEEETPLSGEHVLSLFARGLGIEHEDTYKRYRLWRDLERVMAEMAPCMQARGIEPDRARTLVEPYFPAQDA